MRVLFAIGNAQTSKNVADKYFQMNGEKLDYKDVFYFRALLEEVKKDKSYDRIIISEELEPIKAVTIEEIDQKIFSNIDNITDELQNAEIAFIGSDRRTKTDPLISRLFNIGVYSLLLGNDRNITSLCNVIKEPKSKKEAKEYLNLNPAMDSSASVKTTNEVEVPEAHMASILKHYEKLGDDTSKYISSFETIEEQFSREQLVIIAAAICTYLPSIVPETIGKDPRYSSLFEQFLGKKRLTMANTSGKAQKHIAKKSGILNFLTGKKETATEKLIKESTKIQEEEEKKAREASEKAEAESKKMREEAEKASRLQMEQLKKERETEQKAKEQAEKQAREQEELRQRAIAEQKAKEQAEKQAREQEELRQRAIAEQKAKEQAEKQAREQEELRQRAIAEQKAKEQAKKQVNKQSEEIEIDLSALQKESPVSKASSLVQQNSQEELRQRAIAEQKAKEQAKKQVNSQSEEIEIDLSALQKESPVSKASSSVQQNSQEELRQSVIAEQKAKEQAEKQAREQEELRQKAIAEQKAKEQAEKQAREQEELRQKAIAEQKAKEQAEKEAREQEELRQKAIAEQKAKEQAEKQAREQGKVSLGFQVDQVADKAFDQASNATSVEAPMSTSALLTTNVEDGGIESNFATAMYQLPSDYKKVVAFVGTNKVGTTFVANAVANNTSSKGIKTGLLDMTKSRGLYYLYNKSDQRKIQTASECIRNLSEGTNTPITVDKNKNLLVYTSLPGLGENRKNYKHKTIIDTIKKSCNLLIIDCDFTTPLEYFEQASEIYLVQDMDVIKLQETTAFLREFKNRNIDWSKLSVIINKYVKSSFTPRKIVEVGLAYYNDPQMTYTEEFEMIKSYTTVPFTLEDYIRYTEDVVKDKIVYKNYSVQLRDAIEQICRKIYPVGNENRKKGIFR